MIPDSVANLFIWAVWAVCIFFSNPDTEWTRTDVCFLALLLWIIKIDHHICDIKDKER